MKKFSKSIVVAVLVLFALAVLPVYGGDDHDGETIIPVASVPLQVRKAVEQAVPGIEFVGAEREKYEGAMVYELQGLAGNKFYELKIAADGKVLQTREGLDDADNEDEDISLAQVPAGVKSALTDAIPGLELSEAEIRKEGSLTIYELTGTAGDYDYEVQITGTGKILHLEQEKPNVFIRFFRLLF
ncbi:MAG: PepSY domain-containing protein [Victivallales bacterium]|nr:PepSY domain-containing protein [Victivallales bacterium]